ncbi:Gfo/Idh/MocA family protein [Mycobacteroides saopaulense]|uniref:Gfo/Idh/MocA family protein n=1 Tax=Mycobacteroides saopaulense TaxID=1578165 RepID=UPI0009F3B6AB|nr:Gfo/Idh/MocA family oxidoreductase [Mycobacteroides saopaulense]
MSSTSTVSTAEPLRLIVIGLGHQSLDDHLPAINESDMIDLIGVADVDPARAQEVGETYNVPYDVTTEGLLARITIPDAALIAVPHIEYLSIIEQLACRGVHIIKEKPFAVSMADAKDLIRVIKQHDVTLRVTLQRRFNPIYQSFEQLTRRIGKLYSIEGRYTINIARLDEGWRANRLSAGGGALIDLGYHYIDLIVWYFGLPDEVSCKTSTGNRMNQEYDVEDTALMTFSYNHSQGEAGIVLGSLIVSRVYPTRDELMVAYGSRGSVLVRRGEVTRYDTEGNSVECLQRKGGWPSALIDQIEEFACQIRSCEHSGDIPCRYLEQIALVAAAYESARSGLPQDPYIYLRELLEEG